MQTTNSKDFDYASIAPGYYDGVFRRGRGVQSAWHHLKFTHLRNAMPENYARHLDIGCGAGTFIGTLPAERYSMGIDIAIAQVEYAREKYGSASHEFARANALEALPFDEGSFDVITIVELIEHLPPSDTERLFSGALHVLKPGGIMLATTPNYGSLWPLLEIAVNRLGEVSYEDQHINPLKRGRLLSLLEKAGFDQPSVTPFQGLAPFLAAVSWNAARLLQGIETPLLRRGMGFLLLGTGMKRLATEGKSGH